ncbi:TPA: hypothetical protein PRQ44_004022 [Escherichia coli]|uniref:hypothetical protein n=1 Tax=Escherichia coli TaxID=562 RepID=UPI002AD19D9F|nr:hypothetical protein [Escherichia coli]HDJ8923549.1 hypothetical protein [Escherichia coli]
MQEISFEVTAKDVQVKPDYNQKLCIEVNGVKLSDLIDSVEDNDAIIEMVGVEEIAEYFSTEGRLHELLEKFSYQDIATFLEINGYKVAEE